MLRSTVAAIAFNAALVVSAEPAESIETLSVTALHIENTIPFELTTSHRTLFDTGVFFGHGSIWMLVHPNLIRIDPETYKETAIELKVVMGPVRFLQFGDGVVWVADTGTNTVFKIDAGSNSVANTFRAQMLSSYSALGDGNGSLWLVTAEKAEGTLTRFDASTGEIQAKIDLPSNANAGAIFDFDSVWVPGATTNELYRIDPKTNAIAARIPTCREPSYIASGEGSIWVNCRSDGVLSRIDGATGAVVATIETGQRGQEQIAFGGGYVWLTTRMAGLIQIDPRDNSIRRMFTGPELHLAHNVSYGAGSLWMIRLAPTGQIYRIKPPT